MTRTVLVVALAGGTLIAAFRATSLVCENHARARVLDLRQREIEELTAVRHRLRAEVDAHRPGQLDAPFIEWSRRDDVRARSILVPDDADPAPAWRAFR